MKSFFLYALCLLGCMAAGAQTPLEPVSWEFAIEPVGKQKYKLTFRAAIEEGWYMYAQELASDLGPVPTRFVFEDHASCKISAEPLQEQGGRTAAYDPIFDMELVKFKTQAVFTKEVTCSGAGGVLKGYVEYMCCDNEKCLPPREVPFELAL